MAIKLFDYNSAGKGVAKHGPQKKPFFKFFEIFGRKFWKLIELNMIFVLFCIPVVTFGPAMAAMTHVVRKFTLEQPCFLFEEFYTAFKKNFKQSFLIGIVDVICIASLIIVFNAYFIAQSIPTENFVMMCLFFGAGAIVLMMHFYIYVEIVALNLSVKSILKNAMLLVFLGVKNNFLALVINLALITVIVMFLPFSALIMIFIPLSWMCFATIFVCYPVVQKYIVNPYYEERGERNPELPEEVDGSEALFVDRGGTEEVVKSVPKPHGKVIK
ncbi:MAG: DUF624 domain-containing protein [Eubacterium sp.]|nr:DUF624 domain-containing protein [Eubacterium sp.]